MNIMLIEDNPDDVALIRVLLREAPCLAPHIDIQTREKLSEAIPITPLPDVIVLDLNLPDSRGLRTFDLVRQEFPLLPIIIISGSDDEALAEQAVRHGAQDYLVKGTFEARSLRRAIRYALARTSWAESTSALSRVNSELQNLIQCLSGVTAAVALLNQKMIPKVP